MKEQNLYMKDLKPFPYKSICESRCLFNFSNNV